MFLGKLPPTLLTLLIAISVPILRAWFVGQLCSLLQLSFTGGFKELVGHSQVCFAARIWRRLEASFFAAHLELLRGLFWRLLKDFVQNLLTVITDQHPLFLLAATIPFKLFFISSSLSKVYQVTSLKTFLFKFFFLS